MARRTQRPPPTGVAGPAYPPGPFDRQAVLDGLAPYRKTAAAQFAAFIAAHPDGIYTAEEAKRRDDLYWWLRAFDASEREHGRDDPPDDAARQP